MLANFGFVFVVLVIAFLAAAIRILPEYERGVVFTLGRFTGVKGPGFILLVPVIQRMIRVDLRVIVMDVPTQDVISKDNVSVKVNAVVYFYVVDPERAIIRVERYYDAVSQLAQTTLRSVLGQHELDDMLAERDKLNKDIQTILDNATDAWGVKVNNVEIKHVDLDESAPSPGRRRRNARGAPRSFTPMARCRPPRNCAMPRRDSPNNPRPCNFVTCRP